MKMSKILVIEDEILTLDCIQEFLEAENFQVIRAESGEIALEIAQIDLPDLIVCDLMLPKMNGYEVLSSLRKNCETGQIPLILLTAKTKREDVRKGMEMGADDYITKPFLPEELLKAIAAQLKKRQFLEQCYSATSPSEPKSYHTIGQPSEKLVNVSEQNSAVGALVDRPHKDRNRISDSLMLADDLRHALLREELHIHYQPQISLDNGEIVGCEALLRWQHPQRGNISPEIFIPIAEETGLINPIGDWLISKSCQQLKTWQQAGFKQLKLSLNISPYQLNEGNLNQIILEALANTKIAPQYLGLELTESSLVNNPKSAAKKLNSLKSLGLYLAIDDFGTGYSCLSYLQQFPFDVLKVDRRFVDNIFSDYKPQVITKAIIQMAHSLKLRVIVEGVETQEQFDFFLQHQCDAIQGNFFSRPLSSEPFVQYLQKYPISLNT